MTLRELQELLKTAELILDPNATVLIQTNNGSKMVLDLKLVNGELVLKAAGAQK